MVKRANENFVGSCLSSQWLNIACAQLKIKTIFSSIEGEHSYFVEM